MDSNEQLSELQEQLEELRRDNENLRKDNQVLKISNQNDLNLRIISLEHKVFDIEAERDKLKTKIEIKDQKISEQETELEILRGQLESAENVE